LLGEVVKRISGASSFGEWFRSEIADVLGADFHIGLADSEEHRVSYVIAPEGDGDAERFRDFPIAQRTFTSPLLDATMPHQRWWRAAEIPAANGHGNAHSVALVQQIIANNGHANGHRFFSEQTGQHIFERQNGGTDIVLGIETNFGFGYGLASSVTPIGPRACFWGGYGGSVIMMDQEQELTISYMMNNMRSGLVGDDRGAAYAFAAAIGASR
jgi:CubicO group peptidase (beta-lactamase class C family)